jgi:predicted ester cyclase
MYRLLSFMACACVCLGLADVAQADSAPVAKLPTIVCEGNETNLQIYLKIHEVLFSERDTSRVEEFYASEIISHNVDSGGGSARVVTSAQLAAMWERSKRMDPERVLADDLIICSGDFVVVRTTVHNADNSGVRGNPPTLKSYSITATDIYRFENGRVVERWGNADLVSMFDQIGYTFVPKATLSATH